MARRAADIEGVLGALEEVGQPGDLVLALEDGRDAIGQGVAAP